ncbi:ferredoxin [Nocardia sp. alder85J]|uniref:ferredoxin n=1 Tax=Nocardia sp. alder85J TaxID=2862949 RepID=UPI001CD7BE70|nr:ferredoxin [Nocardia sp. alder85J]MCX4098206.1 ferredoxin [Nocardia sp. alder85J]
MYWDPRPIVAGSAGLPVSGLDGMLLGPPDHYLRGRWGNRDWRNVPGPFYGALTDSCWVGRLVAPDHIVYEDDRGSEVVFRQPRNARETQVVLTAAWSDPFHAYACDGDDHWTLEAIRDWWAERKRLLEWIDDTCRAWSDSGRTDHHDNTRGLRAYRGYVADGLETSLREYGFWLEQRRSATTGEALPTLG